MSRREANNLKIDARREIQRGYSDAAAVACQECRMDYKESTEGQWTPHLRNALGRQVLADGTYIFAGQTKANGSQLPRLDTARRG